MKGINIITSSKESISSEIELVVTHKKDIKNEMILNHVKNFSIKESKICSVNEKDKLVIFSLVEDIEDKEKVSKEFLKLFLYINGTYDESNFYVNIKSFERSIQKEILFKLYDSSYSFTKYLSEKKESTNSLRCNTTLDSQEIIIIEEISKQRSHCKLNLLESVTVVMSEPMEHQ